MGRCTTPRISTALRQLADLGAVATPSPWWWSVVSLESIGRVVLPVHARRALARSPGATEIRSRAGRAAWLVRRGGPGAVVVVDGRGRMYLPAWLRPACAGGVLVGTRSMDGLVLVASTRLLDALGDRLAGPAG